MNRSTHFGLWALVAALSGCSGDAATDEPLVPEASTRNHLIWKRHHAVEQDFARALELPAEDLCTELGAFNCIRDVHLAALGGNDPFGQGLYEPLESPLVTTPLALDRIALAACGARVERDRLSAVVFTQLDLAGEAPQADSEAFMATITTLYQRFLGRDPEPTEAEHITELLVDDAGAPVSASAFAHLACFTVATTTEFLYF